jgi:hypothetical protein
VNGSAFSTKPRASTARCLKNSLSIDTPTQQCQHDPRCGSSSHTNRCRSLPTCMWFGPRPPAGLSRPHTALRLRAVRMRFNQCGDSLDFPLPSTRIPLPQRWRRRGVTGRSTAPIGLSLFQALSCASTIENDRIETSANVSFSTPGYEPDSPVVALSRLLPFLFIPI